MRFVSVVLALAGVALAAPACAQTVNGAQQFKQRCAMCHAGSAVGSMGPSLAKVSGRKAGSGTFRYSPALKASNIVWNKTTLDKYIAGPSKMVPGTRMTVNVSDATQRAALVAYLLTLK